MGAQEPRVVLLSGGLDSSAFAFLLGLQSLGDLGLFIDYGQVTAAAERRSANAVGSAYGFKVAEVSVPGLAVVGAGTLIGQVSAERADGSDEAQRAEWFPARNLLLISIGAALLGRRGGGTLFIGCSEPTYRDTTQEFVKSTNAVLRQTFEACTRVQVEKPAASRFELVSTACDRGFEPRLTFSCNYRHDRHCWRCTSCLDREDVLARVRQ